MKKMKKFLLALFMILTMLPVTIYADETDASSEETTDDEALREYYEQMLQQSQSIEEQIENASIEQFETYFAQAGIDEANFYVDNSVGVVKNAMEAYLDYLNNDLLGEYTGIKDSSVQESKKGYVAKLKAEYEKTYLNVTMKWDYLYGQPTPTAIEFAVEDKVNRSLVEKLGQAALNTLIGISLVVVVLVFIAFIISRFKYIYLMETKKKDQQANMESVQVPAADVAAPAGQTEELVNDEELVAVITAAISASLGASSNGFVVRSIRKSKRM